MEILTGIFSKIIEYTVEQVGRQVGYLINYNSNLQSLRSQLDNLNAAKDRMKHRVDEAERNCKGVEADVQNWRKEADVITQEAEKILENEGQAKTKCFRGVCPNLVSYHQLSRESSKLAKRIELHKQVEFPRVSYDAAVEDISAIPSQEYMAFKSRTSLVKKIMKELKNPDTNMIGVYGLGGVGKTTLAKEVCRQAREERLFDDMVIILDVKQKQVLEIQKEIAEHLHMDFEESHQSMAVRANYLWRRIKDKKTLVILDDVLGRIDLDALGLLHGPTCNLLLTSRDRKVLVSEMRTQKNFQLDLLCQQDSLSLFEKMAGDVVKDGGIQRVANELAKKCGGLPILVVAVASGLRESSLDEWKDTLRRFERFDDKELTEKAFLVIEWSYNRLDAEELKPLFLLCGILVQSSYGLLSDLLKYAIGLGWIKNVRTVEEARNALHSLVRKLKNSSLLLDGCNDGTVRMHDVVRDVAVHIASRDQHVLSRAYTDLDESPSKDCSLISLHYCTISKLLEAPWECPKLTLLCLGASDDSLEIPRNFFEGMEELKVLDLTGLRLPSLPPSLQFRTKLQTLCLDQCVLGDIALAGQLTNLKILSLVYSKVKELPKQIGQLTRLQLLDLSYCSELVLIPHGVISSLTRLEDLRMGIKSFKQWEGADGRSNASIIELKHLSKLTALEIHIPDANILLTNLLSDKLERYIIVIGDCWQYPNIYGTSSNMLQLKLATSNQLDGGMKSLLKRCEHLSLDEIEALNIISYLLHSDGAKQLKHLHVQNNDEVRSVINSISRSYSHTAFPILESLSLDNLANLESVCFGAEPCKKLQSLTLRNLPKLTSFSSKGSRSVVNTRTPKQLSFDAEAEEEIILGNEIGGPPRLFMNGEVMLPNLTTLIMHRCGGLRFLFSFFMATSLVQLTHLQISSCQIMEEIVKKTGTSEENTDNIFRKLKHLQLQHLPSLTRFCSGSYLKFPSLELLHLQDCSEGVFIDHSKIENVTVGKQTEERDMKKTDVQCFLLDEKVGFPSLESLMIYDMPKLTTIWHRQLAPDSFRKLKKVEVLRCHSLISIFAPSMMGRLNALETLKIEECKSLQVVFEQTYDTSTTELKTFECPNLDLVDLDSCESLKNIFPASVAKALQQLRHLHVKNCGILEEIVAKEGVETTLKFVFPKVEYLIFERLPQLRSFYPGLHVSKWPLLKHLSILECGKVEIFASEYSRWQERHDSGVVCTPINQPFLLVDKGNPFPNLKGLGLDWHTEIWYEAHGPLPAELFINLKEIRFSCAHPNSFAFLEKLHDLEGLLVFGGPWKEIFVYEGTSSGEIDAVGTTLPHIKNLRLQNLEELMHLGNDNSESIFPNLEILKVYNCGRLKNLTSSAISFRNITTLDVFHCNGLKYLVTYSVAKCLHQIKWLEVERCESITEIVASNGDEQDSGNYYEIAFSSLQHLKLSDLPSLRGFCSSENCTVRVPSLNSLSVENCLIELKISPDGSLIQSGSRPEILQITEQVEEEKEKEDDGNETGGRKQLIAHTN